MNALSRLGVALLLAIAAAVLNFTYVTLQPPLAQFTALGTDVRRGDLIDQESLISIGVPGDASVLRASLLPYESRAVLYGSPATRDYATGDFVYQRDVAQRKVDADAIPEILRFRVIAVGSRFKRDSIDSDGFNDSDGQTVTIAVKQPQLNDRDSLRMLRLVKAQAMGRETPPDLKILGVVVYPRAPAAGESTNEQASPVILADDEMALPVSLGNVDSVPAVILAGGEIGFMLAPAYP